MASDCFSESTAAALCSGGLTAPEMAVVETHMDTCSDCADFVGLLAQAETDETAWGGHQAALFVGRYLLLTPAGNGTMGQVYKAYDPQLERTVAIKLLRDDGSAQSASRLLSEARVMAKLSHANVVAVHDSGSHEGQVFLAMDYVDGMNLREFLAVGNCTTSEILKLFVDAGRGLAAAHKEGIVHRDFKPDNLLVRKDGVALVTDFGLSRPQLDARAALPGPLADVLETPELTQTGVLVGTPLYMSPEQLRGGAATARSDQFAFAVALYHALCGQRPFAGSTPAALLSHIERDTMEFKKNSAVPGHIQQALLRALSPEPASRFPNMETLLSVLQRAPRGQYLPWVVAAVLVFAVLGAWLLSSFSPDTDSCSNASQYLAGTWDPTTRQQAHGQVQAIAHPDVDEIWQHTATAIDHYADQWTAMHTATCHATREQQQPAEVYAVRMECLSQRQRALSGLVQELGQLQPADLSNLIEASLSLPPIADCRRASELSTLR